MILVPLDIYAQTKKYLFSFELSRNGKNMYRGNLATWDRGWRKGDSEDDFWERVNFVQCVVYAKKFARILCWIVFLMNMAFKWCSGLIKKFCLRIKYTWKIDMFLMGCLRAIKDC